MTPIASGMLFESIISCAKTLQLFYLIMALGMIVVGIALFELTNKKWFAHF
jgi:hypothetical protein